MKFLFGKRQFWKWSFVQCNKRNRCAKAKL